MTPPPPGSGDQTRLLLNRRAADALLELGLLDAPLRELLDALLPSDRVLDTPAAVFDLAVDEGLLSGPRLRALRQRLRKAGATAALAILLPALVRYKQAQAARRSATLDRLLPGPRWLWTCGLVLLVALLAYARLRPIAAPACDSAEVRSELHERLEGIMAERDLSQLFDSRRELSALREVGYSKVHNVRACIGQVTYRSSTSPYAFIIKPHFDGSHGEFIYERLHAEIVTARFGQIGADGDYPHNGEPIGRYDIETALERAIRVLPGQTTEFPASRLRELTPEQLAHYRWLEERSPAAFRRIDNVIHVTQLEPLGACRAVTPGHEYICPLLVELKDPLDELSRPYYRVHQYRAVMVRGEFTLERDLVGMGWRTGPAFKDELLSGIVAATRQPRAPAGDGAAAPD